MKRQLTEQEKIFANHILTRTYSLKFLQRHTNVQQVYEKMLSATSYQGNANQTTMRYHIIPAKMAIIIKRTKK